MSPRPSSRSAPLPSRMTRESIFDETLNAMREGRFALMTPVRTSTDGRCVATTRWMPDRARLLRDPHDRLLDVLGRRHHEIGELVDDDHDERHRLELEVRVVGVLRPHARHRLGVLDRRVVLLRVADLAEVRERLEPLLHRRHRPLQRVRRLLRVGDDRRRQVRQVLVHLELDHLRVDEDELHLVRPRLVDDRRDERVDPDALAGPGRAGDQQVRHRAQVVDDRLAVDVLAERERQHRGRALESLGLDDVADAR